MRYFLLFFVVGGLFLGCSSKSRYEPTKVEKKLQYDVNLKSTLLDVSRDGATYKNGMVVTKKRGLLKDKIPSGYHFVYDSGRAILVSNEFGDILVLEGSKEIFKKRFAYAVASGAIRENLLAVVLSNNTLVLYDMRANKELYKETLEPTFANDARVANPLFLNDLIVFPTLDGRLLIMDAKRKVMIRDVAISNKSLFNNVIFLGERDNVLIAATASKIIAINPRTINTKRIDVKDLIFDQNRLYIFTKTGKILLTDLHLNVKKEIKFPFAIFSAVMDANKLYAVEKNGYLIEVSKDLSGYKVYELPSEIDKLLFGFKDRLFFGQHFLKTP